MATIRTASEKLFDDCVALGFNDPNYWKRPIQKGIGGHLTIREPKGSEKLGKVLALIQAETGLTPIEISNPPVELRSGSFSIRYHRTYTNPDLATAPLLRLYPKHVILGSILEVAPDCSFIVKADHNQKGKRTFGRLGYTLACGVAEPLKTQLESEQLKGLEFVPIKLVPEHKAVKPLWQISSSFRLPRCLLPFLADAESESKYGKLTGSFETYGYMPYELSYQRKEIESMGDFDVALTAEIIAYEYPMREIVVSQKFRKVMLDLKIPGLDYVPVRLQD
jgi:hypothetical protein